MIRIINGADIYLFSKEYKERVGRVFAMHRTTTENALGFESVFCVELDIPAIYRFEDTSGIFVGSWGIEGVDTSKHSVFYRTSVPSMVRCRVPDKRREDLREVLNSLGVKHYDLFDLLVATHGRRPGNSFMWFDKLTDWSDPKEDSKELYVERPEILERMKTRSSEINNL